MTRLRKILSVIALILFVPNVIAGFFTAPLTALIMGAIGAALAYMIWPKEKTISSITRAELISPSPAQRAALNESFNSEVNTETVEHLKGEGFFDLACVGESFRIHNLLKIVGPPQPDFVELQFIATLIPENNNRYDRNAVAVYVEGQHVAYLDRDTAEDYRAAYGDRKIKCNAEIRGSWKDKPRFGVFLDIPTLS